MFVYDPIYLSFTDNHLALVMNDWQSGLRGGKKGEQMFYFRFLQDHGSALTCGESLPLVFGSDGHSLDHDPPRVVCKGSQNL
jgi:hypothetical protein